MVTKLFSHRIKQLFNVMNGAAIYFAVSIYGIGAKKYSNWIVSIVATKYENNLYLSR